MATPRTAAKPAPKTRPLPAKPPAPLAAAAKPAAPRKVAAPAKVPSGATEAGKPVKKAKLVRDSFTIPKAEYQVLDDLKQRAAKLARPVKKSEVLRAGIKALGAMPDAAFLAALMAVPAIKTGRPKAPEKPKA